jgi:hypothetical protein
VDAFVPVLSAPCIMPHHILNSGGISNKFLNFLYPFLCPDVTVKLVYASIQTEGCFICEHHPTYLIVITINCIEHLCEDGVLATRCVQITWKKTYEFFNTFQQTATLHLCSHKRYYMSNLVPLFWMTLYKISLTD